MKKVRFFLSHISWKKIATFSFFLFLSTTFWLMQVYRQPFETTLVFPIKYTAIPDSIIFQENLPSKLTVRVKDDGSALFKYFFRGTDSLNINVSKFMITSDTKILQGATLEQLIRHNLLKSSRITDYSPTRISYQYSALKKKRLPVVFSNQIIPASGYLFSGDIEVIPDSVTAYGSEETLKKISFAYTLGDTIKDYKSARPLYFKLANIPNIKLDPSRVKVKIPIEEFTQKELTIPIECTNTPSNVDVKFFPSTVNISFFVGVSRYKQISENDLHIKFDYNELKKLSPMTTPIKLKVVPKYIRNIKINPVDVEFIFEQK